MKLTDSHLHLYFAPRYWRRTTIIGTTDDTQLRYFEDSAYDYVELETGRYRALIDARMTDVRGHWFVARRPMFSSRVRIPLGPTPTTNAVRDVDGGWWMELVHEPPPEVLEGLYLAVAEAERKCEYAEVLVGELAVCRRAVEQHRRQFVSNALKLAGLAVEESNWCCVVLENLTETAHGLVRSGELPTIA